MTRTFGRPIRSKAIKSYDSMTVDEIASLYGWTAAYVRKLASLDQWERAGRAPTRYAIRDVLDTRNRLHP